MSSVSITIVFKPWLRRNVASGSTLSKKVLRVIITRSAFCPAFRNPQGRWRVMAAGLLIWLSVKAMRFLSPKPDAEAVIEKLLVGGGTSLESGRTVLGLLATIEGLPFCG